MATAAKARMKPEDSPEVAKDKAIEKEDALELENLALKSHLVRMEKDNLMGQLSQEMEVVRTRIYKKAELDRAEWDLDIQHKRFVKAVKIPERHKLN